MFFPALVGSFEQICFSYALFRRFGTSVPCLLRRAFLMVIAWGAPDRRGFRT
jgi:hypothetical protein